MGSKSKGRPEGSTDAAGSQQVEDVGPPGNNLDAEPGDKPLDPLLHNKSHALQTEAASQVLAWTTHRLVLMPGRKHARWTEQHKRPTIAASTTGYMVTAHTSAMNFVLV